MLHPDIVQLKQFYASRLGESVSAMISQSLLKLWPDATNDAMLVIGYGTPYIESYIPGAAPLVVMMPAAQGAATWPAGAPNLVALVREGELPLQNNSINRVLLIHSVEYSESLSAMMQEVWRVLVPGGRVLVIVPNRMSFWSGSASTPFGFGRPFNILQIRSLMTHHHFTLTRTASALFAPPFLTRFSRRLSAKVEQVGRILWWFLGGVLIVEGEKQLYAGVREPVLVKHPYRLAAAPQPAARVSNKDLRD